MKYVVIGALAFPVHGYVRNTLDVDLLFEPTPENSVRLRAVLREFDPDPDTHPFIKGATWETVWARRVIAKVKGVPIPFASLDDLIEMKRAAGRPTDAEDLRVLEELARRRPAGPADAPPSGAGLSPA